MVLVKKKLSREISLQARGYIWTDLTTFPSVTYGTHHAPIKTNLKNGKANLVAGGVGENLGKLAVVSTRSDKILNFRHRHPRKAGTASAHSIAKIWAFDFELNPS